MSVNLSIKGVPEELAERLRRRAERNHRSLQGELMAIVESATAEVPLRTARSGASVPVGEPLRADPFGPLVGTRRGTKTIEQLMAERAGRFPKPIEGGPLAVDIIRADRDSR